MCIVCIGNYHNKIHIPIYRFLIQSLDRSYRDAIGNVDAVTPFMQMFRGSMAQHITCTNCSNVSTSLQPFNDIGLDIDHVRTLNDAIHLYFKANLDIFVELYQITSYLTQQFDHKYCIFLVCTRV